MSSENPPFSEEALAWLGEALGGDPRRFRFARLSGSTSSTLYRIECAKGPRLERYVLRLLDNGPWLAEEPDLAEHEWAALDEARRAGLKAPAPIARAGAEAGFGVPAVLMRFVEGEVRIRPDGLKAWIERMAFELAAIHAHTAVDFPWRYRSWTRKDDLTPPPWSAAPELWEAAITRLLEGEPGAPTHFLHRDYHPVNLLWLGDEISGVVDWINACLGPAGVDVAHCRTNLALMCGPDAAEQFLKAYTGFAPGFVYDPYWDFDSIFGYGMPEPAFYSPWGVFGLGRIPVEVLKERLEEHLRRAVRSGS